MPKFRLNPLANTVTLSALPSFMPCITLISPALLSATKTSPFGAVRNSRGCSNPVAKSCTWKPGGACSEAFAGRARQWLRCATKAVAKGSAKSATVILRNVPGLSVVAVENAARPVSTFAGSSPGGQASATEIPAQIAASETNAKKAAFRDRDVMGRPLHGILLHITGTGSDPRASVMGQFEIFLIVTQEVKIQTDPLPRASSREARGGLTPLSGLL